MRVINTEKFSAALRHRSVDLDARKVLLTDLRGSDQEADLTEQPNCEGLGRIRHFRRSTSPGWPANPLPIEPAAGALGLAAAEMMRAQAFQLASCNWRCWYCYVPFDLLSADPKRARWVTAGEMVDLYRATDNPPRVLDLTGGQPELAPEWTLWTMEALVERGLQDEVYLWSDDNLSNDYLWRYLNGGQLETLRAYRNYGRVGCFKGYDRESFAFNTGAAPELFDQQFELMRRLVDLGLDVYAYATLPSPNPRTAADEVPRFVDRLQRVHENLPLRTVPLEIRVFTPVAGRIGAPHDAAMSNQRAAIELWTREIEARFTSAQRAQPVHRVPLRGA